MPKRQAGIHTHTASKFSDVESEPFGEWSSGVVLKNESEITVTIGDRELLSNSSPSQTSYVWRVNYA